MNNSTFTNTKSPDITMESLLEAVNKLEGFKADTSPKVIMLCKKHYKAVLKQFENKPPVNYYSVIPFGVELKFLIRPYLKKIRIIPAEKLTWQYPIKPLAVEENQLG